MLPQREIDYTETVKIAICRNLEKAESLTVMTNLCDALAKVGISYYTPKDGLDADTDVLCVVGGDGTLFANAHLAVAKGLPIWFINAGSVGFLAESSADFEARAARLKTGKYRVVQRDLLSVTAEDKHYVAMNDVCLMRDTQHLQTVTLEVTSAGQAVACYRGDGALVCTALGSTGYALSAGAPIMSPNAKGMMFVPICAHSMSAKSVLFGVEDSVCLGCKEAAVLFVDGLNCGTVANPSVEVKIDERKVCFVVTEEQSFFAKVSTKLL